MIEAIAITAANFNNMKLVISIWCALRYIYGHSVTLVYATGRVQRALERMPFFISLFPFQFQY